MKRPILPLTRDEVHASHKKHGAAIRRRLREFSGIQSSEYFYELVYCLLTPQSSAINAGRVIHLLQQHDFINRDIDPEPFLHQKEFYIRFHKTKAGYLINVKAQYPLILEKLNSNASAQDLREWLVIHVKGMGWKEASHFLRNIGYRDLAILDRHILKNLLRLGVVRRLPRTLTSRRYKLLEQKFHTFALQIGIPMDELDLLFWSMETGEILK
jgi:N-glycosylase/DNA lyase